MRRDVSEATCFLRFKDGGLKPSLKFLVLEVEDASLGVIAEAPVRRRCKPIGIERQSHRVTQIELSVAIEPRLRIGRAYRELARVALLDVLRRPVGDPNNRGRFILWVLLDFDD